jgi:hypothetical protein
LKLIKVIEICRNMHSLEVGNRPVAYILEVEEEKYADHSGLASKDWVLMAHTLGL